MPHTENIAPEWFTTALSVPSKDCTVDVDGCTIVYRRWGNPEHPPLVFLHGAGAHRRWFDHVAPFFATNYSVSALDLSGHGDSGHRDAYNYEQWGKELLAVADETSTSSIAPIVIAHSMGGSVSLKAASTSNELYGVILIDSSILGTRVGEHTPAQAGKNPPPLRRYATKEEAVARFRLRPVQEVYLQYVFEHVADTSVHEVDGGWTWKFDPNVRNRGAHIGAETVKKVRCEIALIRCQHGRVSPNANEWYANVLGRPISMFEIPDAFHSVMMDRPLALIAELQGLLTEWSRARLLA